MLVILYKNLIIELQEQLEVNFVPLTLTGYLVRIIIVIYYIEQGGPKVFLHLNRQLRRAAPSKWGREDTKCKSGQWEFSAMASVSRRQLAFCVCE